MSEVELLRARIAELTRQRDRATALCHMLAKADWWRTARPIDGQRGSRP